MFSFILVGLLAFIGTELAGSKWPRALQGLGHACRGSHSGRDTRSGETSPQPERHKPCLYGPIKNCQEIYAEQILSYSVSIVLNDKSFNCTVKTPPYSLMYLALSLKGKVK
jgi:hypothetical protein